MAFDLNYVIMSIETLAQLILEGPLVKANYVCTVTALSKAINSVVTLPFIIRVHTSTSDWLLPNTLQNTTNS